MATTLIKNVQRTLAANAGYGLADILNYMAGSATTSTTEITVITKGEGTPDPTSGVLPGASSGGSFYGAKTTALMTTINSAALNIEVTPASLATWPGTGFIYFTSPAEGIYYESINPSTSSASGNDEFVIPAAGGRGWSGTASSHTAPVAVYQIIPWFVVDINRDVNAGVFNFSYMAKTAVRVGYQPPDIPQDVYSQDRSLGTAYFGAYELVEESDT
tara:strand:+ start:218 stop:868 length:651 start_codon:yes stop_codon:yes gene_type:complete